MTEPVIIAMADQPDGRVRVTMGARDFSQVIVTVERSAMNDPGYLTMLRRLYDQQANITANRRRSAKNSHHTGDSSGTGSGSTFQGD